MHGRAKVKSSVIEQETRRKEKEERVKSYRSGMEKFYLKKKNQELDNEALDIIDDILSSNPDIHSLWNFRKEILLFFLATKEKEELAKLLKTELKFTENCLRFNPKSYCSWHHRQWLLEKFPEPDLLRELELCTLYLKLDERNFHCWDYRRMIASKLRVPPQIELEYTTKKIKENFSNYSSWHYRTKLLPRVHPDPDGIRPVDEATHLNELELVVNAAFTDPNDQSAWFYQRWLLGRCRCNLRMVRALLSAGGSLFLAFSGPVSAADVLLYNHRGSFTALSPTLVMTQVKEGTRKLKGRVKERKCTKFKVKLSDKSGGGREWSDEGGLFLPSAGFSLALTNVLADQLASCNQLLDLEPTSKWTLLTSTHLMAAIDRKGYKEEIMKRLNLLRTVDPMREGYYIDQIGKYEIEYMVEEGSPEVSLSNCSIRSLYHLQYLLHCTKVDLSDNLLTDNALSALVSLQSCQVLRLDGNKLTGLEGLPALPQLQSLSLARNHISSLDRLLPFLARFPSLTHLNITQNPLKLDSSASFTDMPNLKVDFD